MNHYIKNTKTKTYRILRSVCAISFSLVFSIFYFTDIVAETFQATPDFFNQTRGYEAKGAIAEFLVNTKYIHLSQPEDYDPSTLEKNIQSSAEENAPTILETALKNENKENFPPRCYAGCLFAGKRIIFTYGLCRGFGAVRLLY